MRDYGKVHSSFWTSSTTRSMSEDARLLALYLLTSPHNTIAGVFRLPDGYVCEDMQWAAERVVEGFRELFDKGFANRCGTTKWVWICKHLGWNPPENPNQRKAAAKQADQIPEDCAWRPDFMRVWGESLGFEPPANTNPSGTLPQPSPNQEQEQEQEQEKSNNSPNGELSASPAADAPTRADAIPYQAIVDAFNRTLTGLPKVRELTSKRRTLIRSAWQASPHRRSMDFWQAYLDECQDDAFLNGTGPYANGHENWRPSFDYLLRADVVTRTFERAIDRMERAA
jgi:hypothetical protein